MPHVPVLVARRYLAIIPEEVRNRNPLARELFFGECIVSAACENGTLAVVWLDAEVAGAPGELLSFVPPDALVRLLDEDEPAL